jgi:GTP cyclohydrolase I
VNSPRLEVIADAYRIILVELLGSAAEAEGVIDSPMRAAKAIIDLTEGYREGLSDRLKVFVEPGADQLVLVGPIEFWSLCEHHLLPFYGVAIVAYIPSPGKIIGLSKIPRIVEHHARRLQNQERLGNDIASELGNVPGLDPRGVGVVLSSTHSCMAARGARSSGRMITSVLRGAMFEGPVRAEFVALARDLLRGGSS